MFVIVAVLITILAGGWFRPQEEHFAVYPSPYLTHRLLLSRYNPALLGTPPAIRKFSSMRVHNPAVPFLCWAAPIPMSPRV